MSRSGSVCFAAWQASLAVHGPSSPTKFRRESANFCAAGCRIGALAPWFTSTHDTIFEWLKRGKTEKNTKYSEFSERVGEAKAQWEAICMRTVRSAVVGGWYDSPVYDKDGNPIPQIDPETGEVLRDERGRPKMVMKSEFREPDARLAWQVAQRMNKAEFGDVDEKTTPDPQTQIDQLPTTKPVEGESAHRKISTSLLAQAVKILADQGVDIPGFIRDPNAKKAKAGARAMTWKTRK